MRLVVAHTDVVVAIAVDEHHFYGIRPVAQFVELSDCTDCVVAPQLTVARPNADQLFSLPVKEARAA